MHISKAEEGEEASELISEGAEGVLLQGGLGTGRLGGAGIGAHNWWEDPAWHLPWANRIGLGECSFLCSFVLDSLKEMCFSHLAPFSPRPWILWTEVTWTKTALLARANDGFGVSPESTGISLIFQSWPVSLIFPQHWDCSVPWPGPSGMGTVRGCPLLAHSLISEQQMGLRMRWEGSTALGAVREPGFLSSSALHTECSGTIFSDKPSVSFSYCSWGSQGKNAEVVCHSLLQWIMFCQNSPSWLFHLGWPYTAWLIVSLSHTKLE